MQPWRSGCPGAIAGARQGSPPSLPPSPLSQHSLILTPTGTCGERLTDSWWALASRPVCLSDHDARPASTRPCARLHGDSEGHVCSVTLLESCSS